MALPTSRVLSPASVQNPPLSRHHFSTGRILQEKRLGIKTHQEYFQTILFRDLMERHDVSHPKAVTDLAHWRVDNTASLYSVNSLTGYLKSLGHKAPTSAVSDYLTWFEDASFLFTVRIFEASLARSNTNPKKNLLRRSRLCHYG
jgi:uncharacterized protein